ncbi:MAG: LysE/ArgO family amino acid transporter [Pelistega sp.]|nr:LysE/ArgO family amino acid transporter [Pelistega sp.]
MSTAFFSGFLLSFSLILAIGSQNAFVLRQGLKEEHVFWVCLTCAISDATLIGIGVSGFSLVLNQSPILLDIIRYAGAAFLFTYGFMHLRSALRGGASLQASPEASPGKSLKKTLLITLALTWLNPHVYLDTLLLIGSVSTKYPGQGLAFFIGAALASAVFFFSLGYGARLLQPFFKKPRSWQILDFLIFIVMFSIAISLLLN